MWVFATQFIGFGIAGLSRRFLVKPKAMLWPGILSSVALYVTLHRPDQPSGRWTMSRYKFFWVSFAAVFVYTWIPEYFMVSLQAVAVLCLVTSNKTARFLGSGDNGEGVGMGMFTFDWYYVGTGALVIPFVYMVNTTVGAILYTYIVVPVLYYTNQFNSPVMKLKKISNTTEYYPTLNNVRLFNRTGHLLDAKILMNNRTYNLNEAAFAANGPIYISEYFTMSYIANFLALTATFSHVGLWYGKNVWRQMKQAFRQQADDKNTDVHNQLMKAYYDVPEWMYLIFLAVCIAFMSAVVSLTSFHMPIWAVFMGVGITGVTLIPLGMIEAVTGTRIYLNVLSQMIIGLIIPGQTISVMAYKSLGVNSALQALTLISDLKLGHYMKVPPVAMVGCQLYGTFLGAITTTSVSWLVMEGMKSQIGSGDWRAIGFMTFYNAGAIWGAIGPTRFFGIGTPYESLLWGFLIGFLLPFLPWVLLFLLVDIRLIRLAWTSHVSLGILEVYQYPTLGVLLGCWRVPEHGAYTHARQLFLPVLFIQISSKSLLFLAIILIIKHDWWKKYNYVLSASISGAVSLCVLVISVFNNLGAHAPVWAGNPDIDNDVPIDYYCTGVSYR